MSQRAHFYDETGLWMVRLCEDRVPAGWGQ
jgi:hypothetical protein